MSRVRSALAVVLGTLGLAGCAVGPEYAAPEITTPDRWHVDLTHGLREGSADLRTWWSVFQDPVLEGLITRAEGDGYDLQQAAARVRFARSLLGVAKGARVPDLLGNGSLQWQGRPQGQADELFALGADSAWELDLWGRVRRSVEASSASYEASVETYRDTLVVVFAEVALSYVDVRTFQARLRYARGNVEIQRQSLGLSQDRKAAGLVGDLDVRQAELNLARTQSRIPQLEQGLAQAVHRLAVLTGQLPSALYGELLQPRPVPKPPEGVIVGLPTELLRQRPDIRAAERRLAARTARIGVATADLYPRFSLSGTFSVSASDTDDLFQSSTARIFGVGPTFTWNLFAGGAVRARIEGQEALTEEALASYEQAVLLGYEEVENALVAYTRELERRDALARSAVAAREGARLVNVVYRQGLTQFQNVLDTEQLLFEQEDDLAASQGLVAQNLIRLYKALGGGWSP